MYKEGHAGLTLIVFSPFMLLFKLLGADIGYVLITGFLMVALSSVPDLEYRHYGIKHRGITHTLLFGLGLGILFAFLMGYAFGSIGLLMGSLAGFGGTVSHLVGDSFTYHKFKLFYPFSDKEVAYGFFKAANKTANTAMLTIGVIAFVLCLDPSILLNLLGIS